MSSNTLAAPAAPGVLRDSGTAVSETVVAVGVQVQYLAAQHPAGARTDCSPADLVRELVHGRTPVLDRQFGRDTAAGVVAGGGSAVITGREQARVDETVAAPPVTVEGHLRRCAHDW